MVFYFDVLLKVQFSLTTRTNLLIPLFFLTRSDVFIVHVASSQLVQFTQSITKMVEIDPYKSNKFIAKSLWLCPSGAAEETSKQLITEAAKECGTFGGFIPHVTLAGAIHSEDIIEQTRKLASMLAPYEFQFDCVSGRDAFFQSLFLKLKTTPQVLEANEAARQVFQEKANDPEYMPHLSIVYGNLDVEKKTRIMKEIDQKLKRDNPFKSFTVDSIQVWCTEGFVEEWYCIETIPLTGYSIPDLVESTDVSPENTLSKEDAENLQSSFLDTNLLSQKLASALFFKVEKSMSATSLDKDSEFWTSPHI